MNLHKAITRLENHYQTEPEPLKSPLALQAILNIFIQLEASPNELNNLSGGERKTLGNLYKDIATMPCSIKPSWVQALQKYKNLLPKISFFSKGAALKTNLTTGFSTSTKALTTDPLIEKWKKADENTNEHKAYALISEYSTHIKDLDLPSLDLSNLELLELPSCLFTDPIFAAANISGNKCEKFPQELTIGSVRNIDLYEKLTEQIELFQPKTSARKAFDILPIAIQTSQYAGSISSEATYAVNKTFNAANTQIIKERLQEYKEKHYNELPIGIQNSLDKLETLSLKEKKALDIEIQKRNLPLGSF
ncbi:MAG: hypothetical protein V4489_04710 [Chlamydiota bacterium]